MTADEHAPDDDGADEHFTTGPDGVVHRRPARKHSKLKVAAMVLSVLLVVAVAGGTYLYFHLSDNIRHSRLADGLSSRPQHQVDSAGQSALNILLIGSDTRQGSADCALSGNCSGSGDAGGANADVEMVVHVAPDRSSASILSIPRDTVMMLPRCKDSRDRVRESSFARITNSLQVAPSCTVAAVEKLTGLPIDHFAMVDFSGVVNMSNAVGGVDVCVDGNVYDPYSGLKLAGGKHTLVGVAALQFLRTRHGFGDGSDLGRQQAQHAFLSALIQKMKSAGTLANPATVVKLADAATKALTVDDSLAGVPQLISLMNTLNSVPPTRISFVTMPNVPAPDNPNEVVPAPNAQILFQQVEHDEPLTGTAPSTSQGAAAPLTAPGEPPATSPGKQSGGAPLSVLTTAETPGCIPVAKANSTPFGTPGQAYAANPNVPDSAPAG